MNTTARAVRIRPGHVRNTTLDDLPIGAIVTEGIVVEKSLFDHTYTTPAGTFEVECEHDTIPVLATISDEMIEDTRAAMAARTRGYH